MENTKKKEMEDWDLKELGSMVAEILQRGFSVEIQNGFKGKVLVRSEKHWARISETEETYFEALGVMIDRLREKAGEPTRAQELAALVEIDRKHADAPPVELGKDACCSNCGCRAPLQITRKIKYEVSWRNGRILASDSCLMAGELPEPGEIGTCHDCGVHYRFSES